MTRTGRRPRQWRALAAITLAGTSSAALPAPVLGAVLPLDRAAVQRAVERLGTETAATVDRALAHTAAVGGAAARATRALTPEARLRAADDDGREGSDADDPDVADDPQTQPPMHGERPHAQGTVAVSDTDPRADRPLGGDPAGRDAGEELVVGRTRAEAAADGYRGHITILALFGDELAGVDAAPGQTSSGPLQRIQSEVLDPLCTGRSSEVCLSVLMANAAATTNGSTNEFALARAKALGLDLNAGESKATIAESGGCQAASGSAYAANVTAASGAVRADGGTASSSSTSCRGEQPVVTNSSSVLGIAGSAVPTVITGCSAGTPDIAAVVVPGTLAVVCNADDAAASAAVREALDIFVLDGNDEDVLSKDSAGAAESLTVAPTTSAPAAGGDPGGADTNAVPALDSGRAGRSPSASGRLLGGGSPANAGRRRSGQTPLTGRSELDAGSLPFTGTDVGWGVLAGALMLMGGLMVRPRTTTATMRLSPRATR